MMFANMIRINSFKQIGCSCLSKNNNFKLIKSESIIRTQCLHTSKKLENFHEMDPVSKDNRSYLQHLRKGLSMLKDEVKLWKKETKDILENDPLMIQPGNIDIVWNFKTKDTLDNWIVTSDKDNNAGYSSCELFVNGDGKAVFQGILNTEVPQDGVLKKSGYCNIKSARYRKSFQREGYLDWGPYTHLVLRVRGDGRSFLVNLHTPGYYDILWNDIYQYVLFTRGGPYWQISKIPFSKFVLCSQGKVQDNQCAVPLENIANFGLTLADKNNGPFKLEIDYIGLEYDPDYTEEFAYEMYQLPRGMANS